MLRSDRASLRFVSALALLLSAGCIDESPFGAIVEETPAVPPGTPVSYPSVILATDLGNITLILYPEAAPVTVAHITKLVEAGFYDGLLWHRVVDDFVIQTGDPTGTGMAGDDERIPLEIHPAYFFSAGSVGIARDLDSDSGTSQFFICEYPQPHLKKPSGAVSELYGRFTMLGQVVAGMDVVRAIAAVETTPVLDRPARDVRIRSAEVGTVTLASDVADALPLQTSPKITSGSLRATLETPREVVAGRAANVTLYLQSSEPLPADLRFETRGPGGVTRHTLAALPSDDHVRIASLYVAEAGSYKAVVASGAREIVAFDLKVEPARTI